MNLKVCLLPAWCAVLAAPLQAQEDVKTAVPLPALESDPVGTVVPLSCAVVMTGNAVAVDLGVRTREAAPALLINGLRFGWTASPATYSDRQFPELEIRLNGTVESPQDRVEIFAGPRNITLLLRQAEMDPWAITRTPPVATARPQYPEVLNLLKNAGAIEAAGDGYTAKWEARRMLRISLKAVSRQRVELRYLARPGIARLTAGQLLTASRERSDCLSPGQLRRFLPEARDSSPLRVIEYTIPTGIDGEPPASVTFTAQPTVEALRGQSAIFFCAPHGKSMARTGPVTREPVEVNEQGSMHVLRVTLAPP